MKSKQEKLEEIIFKRTGMKREANESFEQFEARVKAKDNQIAERTLKNLNAAKQMYQYCVDNHFGNGMNEKWGIKHFKLIEQALQSDEEVLMCFIGLHNYVSMTKHDNNFAYAITNKRVIMAQQKVIGQVVQSVLLKNLNDITANSGITLGVITIDTIKEKFNVCVDIQSANNICEKVHEVLLSMEDSRTAQPQIQIQQTSSADEILKYKNLLDMGIITQDEFEQKKKQLLGL
ncbi:PH domain-containing protein [Faecalicoccus pleomorphus]|uniref:PH domain-containing protein n=1 Tax=Faecalicoccus pleomorphus TaxID=1323 RepID=UPI0024303DDF|nr:PH domain-containing protein [Faecalicoccus pleomorphus]